MSLPTRRTFLQTAVAAAASLFLPRGVRAESRSKFFWFLHSPTGKSWPVDDPVAWSLENARQPILERARERLVTLDGTDPQRVIRVVVRRCKLNLLEIHRGRVVVHHWGQQGQGDLRPQSSDIPLSMLCRVWLSTPRCALCRRPERPTGSSSWKRKATSW